MYKYKFCSTYGYFCTSIDFVTPTGDLNKYKSAKSTSISISFVTPTGDLDKFKSIISTSRCISFLYESMQILISATVYLLLLYAYC